MSVAGDVLLDKSIVYHILNLYVECNVLCGNKALLNWSEIEYAARNVLYTGDILTQQKRSMWPI